MCKLQSWAELICLDICPYWQDGWLLILVIFSLVSTSCETHRLSSFVSHLRTTTNPGNNTMKWWRWLRTSASRWEYRTELSTLCRVSFKKRTDKTYLQRKKTSEQSYKQYCDEIIKVVEEFRGFEEYHTKLSTLCQVSLKDRKNILIYKEWKQ